MLRYQQMEQLCAGVAARYKPWVKRQGIVKLFDDAYARVGLVWGGITAKGLDTVEAGPLKEARRARRMARYVHSPQTTPVGYTCSIHPSLSSELEASCICEGILGVLELLAYRSEWLAVFVYQDRPTDQH